MMNVERYRRLEGKSSTCADDLPVELLRIIASNLFGKDVQSFSLVCKSWNVAVYQRSPCLMLYHRAKKEWQFHQHSRVFHMKLSQLDRAHICSSNHGWLLMSREDRNRRTLFFFDPFNRRKINLPLRQFKISFTGVHFFHPPTSPECFIVGFDGRGELQIVIFSRSRENETWERHIYDSKDPFNETPSPPILRRGVLYFVGVSGNVMAFDLARSCWTTFTNCLPFPRLRRKIKQHYLFQIKGDDALYVAFLIHESEKVSVFRLSEPKMEWELVRDLGDKMVYLSQASCFGATAPIGTNMANKLYFPIFHEHKILSYSLKTRKYHSLDGDYSHDDTHGLTQFHTPVAWILPARDANHSHWPLILSVSVSVSFFLYTYFI